MFVYEKSKVFPYNYPRLILDKWEIIMRTATDEIFELRFKTIEEARNAFLEQGRLKQLLNLLETCYSASGYRFNDNYYIYNGTLKIDSLVSNSKDDFRIVPYGLYEYLFKFHWFNWYVELCIKDGCIDPFFIHRLYILHTQSKLLNNL